MILAGISVSRKTRNDDLDWVVPGRKEEGQVPDGHDAPHGNAGPDEPVAGLQGGEGQAAPAELLQHPRQRPEISAGTSGLNAGGSAPSAAATAEAAPQARPGTTKTAAYHRAPTRHRVPPRHNPWTPSGRR
jgi:hypothetical protein